MRLIKLRKFYGRKSDEFALVLLLRIYWYEIDTWFGSQQCFVISFFSQSQFLTDLLRLSELSIETGVGCFAVTKVNFINDVVFFFCCTCFILEGGNNTFLTTLCGKSCNVGIDQFDFLQINMEIFPLFRFNKVSRNTNFS